MSSCWLNWGQGGIVVTIRLFLGGCGVVVVVGSIGGGVVSLQQQGGCIVVVVVVVFPRASAKVLL